MALTMRSAVPSDADALAVLHHAAWLATYRHLVPDEFWDTFTLEHVLRRWHGWLERESDVTLAEVDGELVGFALAGPAIATGSHQPVRDLQLYSLYVSASHHGTGVGQVLLDAVLGRGTPAQLWVAEGNPRARRFYARNGFVPDGAAFVDDDSGIAEIRLVRGPQAPPSIF
jgi:GNAT superfamily N-acetyltransferase